MPNVKAASDFLTAFFVASLDIKKAKAKEKRLLGKRLKVNLSRGQFYGNVFDFLLIKRKNLQIFLSEFS